MEIYNQDPKYMLEHKDEFEQLEYGNLELVEHAYYATLFNNTWSRHDIEANAKEGWIKIIAYNVDIQKISTEKPLSAWFTFDPYLEIINGEMVVAKPKLHGEVIIFKLNPQTLELIKKV